MYEQAGVAEYWFVDLDAQRLEWYRHEGDRYGPPRLVPRGEQLVPVALQGLCVDVATVLGPADE